MSSRPFPDSKAFSLDPSKMSYSYQYAPLQRSMIRVVELLECPPDSPDSPIRFNINPVSLKSGTKFEAVSYAWSANPQPVKIILVQDNSQIAVSSDCYEMLGYLRYPNKNRILWIDSICVDQSNALEKSDQLKIMGDIYETAFQTVMFLGKSTPGSQQLFDMARQSQLGQPVDNGMIGERESLFRRSWFSNIWAVQALRRSSQPIFICGSDTMTLLSLQSFLISFPRDQRLEVYDYPEPLRLKDKFFQRHLTDYLPGNAQPATIQAQELFWSFAATGSCMSTNPPDRILALMPLIINAPLSLHRLVDYSQNFDSISYDFACEFLRECGLSVLSVIRHPRPAGNLPSWVPDWTQNVDTSDHIERMPCFFRDYEPDNREEYFRIESRRLIIWGARYGEIQDLGPVLQISQKDHQQRREDVERLMEELESINSGVYAHEDWPTSIQTAVRGIDQEDIDVLMWFWKNKGIGNREYDELACRNVALGCHEARVFITAEMKLGLCSKDAQKGDLICLVRGAMEPCILRKRESEWKLVSGDCHLLEIENNWTTGERIGQEAAVDAMGIWDWIEQGELTKYPIEEFRIC